MRVGFLGLGLIGGSVARALRASGGDWWVGAWTPVGTGPRAALAAGAIDAAFDDAAALVAESDVVVLAAPPVACVELLGLLGGVWRPALRPGVTVTDVASTKLALQQAAAHARLPWVGGHPMAGRETSGFDAAEATLFHGRPWVITGAIGGGDPAVVRALATACGAVPMELEAAEHDGLVAAISHLPLLTSVALVESVTGSPGAAPADWAAASALAASGWRDTTRLARGDTSMGAEIAATNAGPLAARLRAYRDAIDVWLELLEAPGGPDAGAIRARLNAAKDRLEQRGG
jgi:prephenate dehydrogenase